ncbi:MAG: hypothetical protein KC472_00040 [Dehalococcoidia bacterium]|nr:hypothetical protein [Dehalococcoidia bacterium]
MQLRAGWRVAATRLRPWQPVVLVDAKRGRARRLRRMLSRATRAQFRALGVPHPDHLLIVVQRTVEHEERQLPSLLQVFEIGHQVRRHVLFLALTVEGEPMSDGAIVAALRQQLHEVVGEALGVLVCAVPGVRTSTPRPAAVVPLRPLAAEPPPFDHEAPFPDDADAPMDPANDGAYAVAGER